jgi:TRAP-type C4-dicarboxylate transport system substrate-binding protein
MKERRWLYLVVVSVVFLLTLSVTGYAKADAPKVIEWNFHNGLPYHPGTLKTDHGLKFAELCKKYLDGRLIVKQYYPGDVYPSYNAMAIGVASGEADSTFAPLTSYDSLGIPASSIPSVPYAGADYEARLKHQKEFWFSNPVSAPKLQKLFRDKGVKILNVLPIAPIVIMTKTKAVTEQEWKKLRLRAPNMDIYLRTVEATSARGVPLPYSEVKMAMKTGVVDGYLTDLDAYVTDRMWEVGANHYPVNLEFMGTFYCDFVSVKFWDKLPADIQKIMVEKVLPELDAWMWEAYTSQLKKTMKLVRENATVYDLPSSRLLEIQNKLVSNLHSRYKNIDPELYNIFAKICGF